MKNELSDEQVKSYRENGFIVIENFLSPDELDHWRETVMHAIKNRAGQKMPGKSLKMGEIDGINEDTEYFGKVFDQILNLWQTDEGMQEMMFDTRLGKMAAKLAGVDGIRIWHDQALFKKPYANPTAWHLDTPFWSFSDRDALSIWVALDDATKDNGCLYFVPSSHKHTRFTNSGIGKNMDEFFEFYPELTQIGGVAAPMKAGSCAFYNGLTIHGANANMTKGYRRAMTCSYMPDGNVYNGIPNILPQEYLDTLTVGDELNNEDQNPLIFHTSWDKN